MVHGVVALAVLARLDRLIDGVLVELGDLLDGADDVRSIALNLRIVANTNDTHWLFILFVQV